MTHWATTAAELVGAAKPVIEQAKKLYKADLSGLTSTEKTTYYDIFEDYNALLDSIHRFAIDQIPVFEAILEKAPKGPVPADLFAEIKFDEPQKLLVSTQSLLSKIHLFAKNLEDSGWSKTKSGLIGVLLGAVMVIGGVAVVVIVICAAPASAALAATVVGFGGMSGLAGLGAILESITPLMESSSVKQAEAKLKDVRDHLVDIIDEEKEVSKSYKKLKFTMDEAAQHIFQTVLQQLQHLDDVCMSRYKE
eukprot:TRINITY_DN5166_c0_g1_i1.p1 TRINITY_DN5166_c0_g1~~TRINITY_DN5166_c0_g1_i1.p1  ORF type:complete len:250 (-),score=70.81 TRINITY_DN5166_c0_g1_i1:37-786(-)